MATTPTHVASPEVLRAVADLIAQSGLPIVAAVATQKGGVGKTTSAVNISYNIALAGFRVLLIDLDPQANATGSLGVVLGEDDGTVFEVLTSERSERMSIAEVVHTTDYGVDVVPSTRDLRLLETRGLGPGGELRLKTAIAAVAEDYDFVIIDCPPALGHMTISALTASREIIAVVGADGPHEVEGLVDLANSVEEVQDALNPDLDIRHVLLANFLGTSVLAKSIRSILHRDWPEEYLGEISRTVRVGEATSRHMPVAAWSPDCHAATDYRDVTAQFLSRIGK